MATASGAVATAPRPAKKPAAAPVKKPAAPIKKPVPSASYPARPFTLDETVLRQAIFDTAALFVGLTERTNHNDAVWIAAINRYNGLPPKSFYCASGLYYAYRVNGVKLPVRALGAVASYFISAKIIYRRNQRGNQRAGPKPRQMDFASLYASHVEGIRFDTWDEEDEYVYLIGFNTTGGKGTYGGCYINRRKKSEIKYIANWLTPYLETAKRQLSL